MDIASQITVAVKPEFYKSKLQMGALEPGSTLKLKIIELNGNRALIDFGNFRTTADIKIPVTLGEELMVRVLEAGKQLKLGVISVDQKNSMSPEISGQRLEVAPGDNLNKAGSDLSRILNQVTDLSGSTKKSSSIFNILASLNAYFEPFELKEIIADINQQQGRAVSQLGSPDPFQVFTFSLPLEEGNQPAKLQVFYEKKKDSESKKGFQISMLLSMDQLGDVRTDFLLLEKDLNINFYVTEPATMVKIQENYKELDDLLGDLFDQVHLNVKVSEKRVNNFNRPDIQTGGSRKVDVRI